MEYAKAISEINGIQNIPWEVDFALSAFKIGKISKKESLGRIGVMINSHAGLSAKDPRRV